MGGPHNTLSRQAPFLISSMAKPPLILQMACAAWLLKDGEGPTRHDMDPHNIPRFARVSRTDLAISTCQGKGII